MTADRASWALRALVAVALPAIFVVGFLYATGTTAEVEGVVVSLHR
jgi:hypothetical protein